MKDGARVTVGGLVLIRQRPGTAKEAWCSATLGEDETGIANAVVLAGGRRFPPINRRTGDRSASFLVVSWYACGCAPPT